MRGHRLEGVSRRRFIANAAGVASALPLSAVALAASSGDTVAAHPITPASSIATSPTLADVEATANSARAAADGYRALLPHEARIVETLVNALCPADALTGDGVSSGLAMFIDAYVGGAVDAAAPGTPQLLRLGLPALDEFSRAHDGIAFAHRSSVDAALLLTRMRAGAGDDQFPLSNWNTEVLEPVLKQACFAAPVYDRYGSRMFVKLFG